MSFTDSSHMEEENICPYSHTSLHEKQFDHVMCFGTFDIFHPGHVFYLTEAQKFAHEMTIIIARDTRVISGKWKHPLHNEEERLKSVKKAFPAAQVILGDKHDIFAHIRTLHPDLLAFGYDQKVPLKKIHELFPSLEIVRICGHETEKWKSSLLRHRHSA